MNKLYLVLSMSLVAATASAESPQAILESVDVAVNQAKDQVLDYEMLDIKDGKERKLALEVYLKGEKRLTNFTAPADLAGTRVLIESDTKMYIYLPSYKKVRRIASHVTSQGFMGTTFSNDDLSLVYYAPKYDAKLLSESVEEYRLELRAKGDAPYKRIDLTVEKKRRLPVKIEYYGENGKVRKTEIRTDYTCEAKVCAPATVKMRDHTDGDHVTNLVRKKWKVNSGLKDRLFTKRSLARAR